MEESVFALSAAIKISYQVCFRELLDLIHNLFSNEFLVESGSIVQSGSGLVIGVKQGKKAISITIGQCRNVIALQYLVGGASQDADSEIG